MNCSLSIVAHHHKFSTPGVIVLAVSCTSCIQPTPAQIPGTLIRVRDAAGQKRDSTSTLASICLGANTADAQASLLDVPLPSTAGPF